ncbi:MAG: hypothetical protein M1831_001092 [Alyxoria varia]|nr:MAG: hypothetical protein M1831_001092 [Alyxoria varia]
MHTTTTTSTSALSRCSSKNSDQSKSSTQSNNTRGSGKTSRSQTTTTTTSGWSTVKSSVSFKSKSKKPARVPLGPAPTEGWPLSISHLNFEEKLLYASILSGPCKNHHPPGEASPQLGSKQRQHLQQKSSLLSNLPHHLKSPKISRSSSKQPSSSPRFKKIFKPSGAAAANSPPSPPASPSFPVPSTLCPFHSSLNPHVVASALTTVEMHIEDYLDDLVRLATPRRLSAEVLALVSAAEDVMALRLSRDEFRAQYKRAAWRRFQDAWTDGCEACALTLVGGTPEVVACLRAVSVLSREVGLENAGAFCGSAGEWFDAWKEVFNEDQRGDVEAMSMEVIEEFWGILGCGENGGSVMTGKDSTSQKSSEPAATLLTPPIPPAPRRSSKRPTLCPSPLRIYKTTHPPSSPATLPPSSPLATPAPSHNAKSSSSTTSYSASAGSLLSLSKTRSPASSATTSAPSLSSPSPPTPQSQWADLPPLLPQTAYSPTRNPTSSNAPSCVGDIKKIPCPDTPSIRTGVTNSNAKNHEANGSTSTSGFKYTPLPLLESALSSLPADCQSGFLERFEAWENKIQQRRQQPEREEAEMLKPLTLTPPAPAPAPATVAQKTSPSRSQTAVADVPTAEQVRRVRSGYWQAGSSLLKHISPDSLESQPLRAWERVLTIAAISEYRRCRTLLKFAGFDMAGGGLSGVHLNGR